MNILYITSEAAPFCKTGGLADVLGSLPPAVAAEGDRVFVLLPLYGQIAQRWREKMNFRCYIYVDLGWRHEYCGLFSLEFRGVAWYFVDNERYFRRRSLYGDMDDGERFAFFSKAAEAMNFTQSGISHAINSLENELGVKLLSRNRGGVVLTADGRAVLPKIEKLCAAHHSLMQTVEGLKDMDSGLVKIATFSSVSAQWLPRILKSFGKVYPNIEFEVVTGDFYDQIEGWIVNGTVDCGFLRLPSVKRLQTYALHRDELQVIVPCDHPYADRGPFPVSALAEEPFIQLEEGDDYEIMAAFDEMGIRPNVKYIAREDRTILAMVSEGLGISLLPELMVRHSPTPIKVCHAPLHFYRTIGIGVKDKKALSNSTRLFVDYVRTWVAENGNT